MRRNTCQDLRTSFGTGPIIDQICLPGLSMRGGLLVAGLVFVAAGLTGIVVDISVAVSAVVGSTEDVVVMETVECEGWVVVVAGGSGGTEVLLTGDV